MEPVPGNGFHLIPKIVIDAIWAVETVLTGAIKHQQSSASTTESDPLMMMKLNHLISPLDTFILPSIAISRAAAPAVDGKNRFLNVNSFI